MYIEPPFRRRRKGLTDLRDYSLKSLRRDGTSLVYKGPRGPTYEKKSRSEVNRWTNISSSRH